MVSLQSLTKKSFKSLGCNSDFRLDGFPLESDRALFFKLTAEVPVQQETLLRIFLIGMSKTLALNGQDCPTIAETLIKRAAGPGVYIKELNFEYFFNHYLPADNDKPSQVL